ncbi:MAG: hypothetical protein ACRDP8_18625 [Actinopolymorphaceae bacterium]
MPFSHFVAWFSLLHRLRVDGWNPTLEVHIDGLNTRLNVATFFVDITGLRESAFNRKKVLDVEWIRRNRPDVYRQWNPPSGVSKVWVVSRFSAPRNEMKKARRGHRKPDEAANKFDSEAALIAFLERLTVQLRRSGDLAGDESLLDRVTDVHTDSDPCALCADDLEASVPHARLHSTVRYVTAEDRAHSSENLSDQIAQAYAMAEEATLFNADALPLPQATGTEGARSHLTDRFLGGGVDFSNLELRYLSTDTLGAEYAFSIPRGGRTNDQSARVGMKRAKESSDAFLVWLALRPEKFTVNLNPNEPDRIIDKDFGRTNTGRVLLEADLRLKQTVAHLIHPKHQLGKEFWAQLYAAQKCVSIRQWIVPGLATVHDTGGELHILDAPLEVQAETLYLQGRGSGRFESCPKQPQAATDHNEALFRRMVLPHVEKAVNTDPDYAALRRVYLSRVAAEWVRNRHGYERTAYDDIIDTGDIDRWTVRDDWTPKDTFGRYVHSYTHGEFTVPIRAPGGGAPTRAYVFGGVDLTNVSSRNVGAAELDARWPGTADAMRKAVGDATFDESTQRMLVGGQTVFSGQAPPDASPEARTNDKEADAGLHVPTGVLVVLAIGVGVAALFAFVVRSARRRNVGG